MSQAAEQNGHLTANKSRLSTLKSLQEAAQKLCNVKGTHDNLSTRELVSMLICQVQRNKRKAQPRVRIHLRFASFSSNPAVKLRLGATNS